MNYGTDTTPEGRMVIRNILLAEDVKFIEISRSAVIIH